MNLDGEYVFCIVPLPKDAQKSVNWKELSFWVVERGKVLISEMTYACEWISSD